MICIQVTDSSTGRPKSNARVSLTFDGFTRLGSPSDERTDSNGCAYFDSEPFYKTIVYVDGRKSVLGFP
jgi:hypothetical protein